VKTLMFYEVALAGIKMIKPRQSIEKKIKDKGGIYPLIFEQKNSANIADIQQLVRHCFSLIFLHYVEAIQCRHFGPCLDEVTNILVLSFVSRINLGYRAQL
jgi:hypothetical protein